MEPIQLAAMVVAIGFLFTFVSTFRFYRRRAKTASADQKKIIRPTLYMSISFLVGAVSYLTAFLAISDKFVSIWDIIMELAMPLFGFSLLIAVVAALKIRKLYTLPFGLLALSYIVSFIAPIHPLDDPHLTIWIFVQVVLVLFPMALFAYLWRSTRRSTTFGMFMGTLLYLLYFSFIQFLQSEYVGALGLYVLHPGETAMHAATYAAFSVYVVFALAVPVLGQSFIYWCFRFSERKLGGELIGYSLSTAVIATDVSIVLLSLETVEIAYSITLLLMILGVGIFILTGSYLYGRYKESRYAQTLMLSIFSYFAGLSYLMFNVGQHLYLASLHPAWLDLVTLTLGMVTAGFLFIAAVFAIGRKRLVVLPPVIIALFFILALAIQPMPLLLNTSMAVAAVLMAVAPAVIFFVLWRRMSKAKEKGRGRVLGILIGFVLMMFSSPIWFVTGKEFAASILGILGAFLAFLSSLFYYLGVSGRMDKWLYERSTKPK